MNDYLQCDIYITTLSSAGALLEQHNATTTSDPVKLTSLALNAKFQHTSCI